ncbi:MAG: hypothetical protein II208_01500, partial [Alphaproteobacteria bacterium]|nr:hypothetical protein [Alphaproteobacteria bacterium]
GENEDMCPQYYDQSVDTTSWGACLCWENGARRSKWGKSTKCVAAIPTEDIIASDAFCITEVNNTYQAQFEGQTPSEDLTAENWCIQPSVAINKDNQVCPYGYIKSIINTNECEDITDPEKTVNQMPNALK